MRRLLASLLAPLALLVPACGDKGGTPDASPQEIVLTSVTKTTDERSARMSMTMTMAGAEGGTITAEGAFDWPGKRGTMQMDMPQLAEMFGGGKIEIVIVGTVIYMKIPTTGTDVPPQLAAKPWLKLDLAKAGELGEALGALGSLGNSDPSATLDQLRGVSGEVTVVGEEDVRGVGTTRYKGTIDLDKAVQAAPESARETLRQLIEQLGTKTVPFEAWVDEEGLLRRMRQTIDMSKAEVEGVTSMTMDMDLYDFGVEVKAEAPPAAQVTDLMELLGGLMGDS